MRAYADFVPTADRRLGGFFAGERVVVEPALGCRVRGIEPPCAYCASERYALCVNVAKGDIAPGIQTGFCGDTGGGWSEGTLVAHPSQLHRVPENVPDEAAVAVDAHGEGGRDAGEGRHVADRGPPGEGAEEPALELPDGPERPHLASVSRHLGA